MVATLDKAIMMLESDFDGLVEILTALGKRHKGYGVLPEHFPIVGDALIGTLQEALGESFTPDVKAAWKEIYGVISSTMIEGAGYEGYEKEEDVAVSTRCCKF